MAFGVKYRVEFKDRKSNDWMIDVLEDSYVGSITDLKAWGNNPCKITFRASSIKLKHAPICPTRVELLVVSETDYELMEFAYSTGKQYKLIVYNDSGSEVFQGFVLKGLGGESYSQPPYPVKIQATDGLAELKNVPYTHIGGLNVVRGSEVLRHITNDLIGISKDEFLDNSNLFPDSITPGATDVSLHSTYVNQELFVQEEMNAYEVLADLMTTHNCRFFQYNEFWVVSDLDSRGANVLYRRRNTTTYSDIAIEAIFARKHLIGSDNLLTGGAISFIEAPKEVKVTTNLSLFDNILEDKGLDNWSTITNWTELGGTMTSGTGAQGYAAQDSFNTQTILGESCLGIGIGVTNSLYSFTATGLTHNITNIVDAGSNIYNLTFTNTFTGIAPTWTILDHLTIRGKGNFEIFVAPTVGAAGVSTMSIRVKDTNSTPKVGDVIIGIWNNLYGLEQTLKIPSSTATREVVKNSSQYLEIEVEYASQFDGITAYNIIPDDPLYFIGVKVGTAPYDTFNGDIWQRVGNGPNLTQTQFLQLEGTGHNEFTKKTFAIPLEWTIATNFFVRLALIGGYATPVVYKSIKATIKDSSEYSVTLSNIADNNTSLNLDGSLFKAQTANDNSEFSAIGGVLTEFGDEYVGFDTAKTKNTVIANFIKDNYSDTVQVWKGSVDDYYTGINNLLDSKNFDRTFQIQEVTNNLNQVKSTITAVEYDTLGNVVAVYTITDTGTLVFAPHSVSESSQDTIQINNTGNIGFQVISIANSVDFFGDNNKYIASGGNDDFSIVSKSTSAGVKNDTIEFREVNSKSNTISVLVAVIVYEDDATFYVNETSDILQLGERYEYESAGTGALSVDIVSIHGSGITVDAEQPGSFETVPLSQAIASMATESFSIQSSYTTLGDKSELMDFDDSANGYTNSHYSVAQTIKGLIQMTVFIETGFSVVVNRIRINGGAWTNLPSGTLDFYFGDTIDWQVDISQDPGNVGNPATMRVYNRGETGGSYFKDDILIVHPFDPQTNTITFVASGATSGYNNVSIDLTLTP